MHQDDQTQLSPPPGILDVEASGFGRGSYPIEIGISLSDGSSHCFLIRPMPDWTHWDTQAEQVHGISREILLKHGQEPRDVAEKLNSLLLGQVLYSDAWSYDNSWVAQLFDSVDLVPKFRIESLRMLLDEAIVEHWEPCKQQVITELNLTRHRASADARILQMTFIRARQQALATIS